MSTSGKPILQGSMKSKSTTVAPRQKVFWKRSSSNESGTKSIQNARKTSQNIKKDSINKVHNYIILPIIHDLQ